MSRDAIHLATIRLAYESDSIAVATLNRPEVANVISSQLSRDLADIVAVLNNDQYIRVLVITGAGKAFCAGADLKEAVSTTFSTSRATPSTRSQSQSSCRSLRSTEPAWAAGSSWPWPVTFGWPRPMRYSDFLRSNSDCYPQPVAPSGSPDSSDRDERKGWS